jgi:DNA-binding NarL/FixJ family response regulator
MRTRVLIADDQAPFRAAARRALGLVGDFHVVGEATSGEEAIALVDSLRPDVLVLDVMMAGVDGITAARAVTAAHPETMTILVSTYREEELPREAFSCGAAAYLHKSEFGSGTLRELWRARTYPASRSRPGREPRPSRACGQPAPRQGRA